MDSSFLVFEGPHTHMHVGGTAIFEAAALAGPDGGVDIDRIRTYIKSRLHLVPRYRQRIAFVPLENRPVWVDDQHFNLNYHVRHACLPHPGDEHQLKRLTGRIISQQLDRGKPLWEAWIVEGLQGGRFALVLKTHHCMVDGLAGVDLLTAILGPSSSQVIHDPPRWVPRPAPGRIELVRDAALRRASAPLQLARKLRQALKQPDRTRAELYRDFAAVLQTVESALWPPARTPLNRPVGPHRRFDWLALDLAEVKAIKHHLGGTVNDVVLATATGAIHRYLRRRHLDLTGLNFRVTIPVNVRAPEEYGTMGNRVSAWLTALPVAECDPLDRYARVRALTADLKHSKQALGPQVLTQAAEWLGPAVLSLGIRLTAWLHPYNLIVSNVPGPQQTFYLLGAPMLEGFPLVPLFENQGLAIALLSYAGKLCWGVNADWDLVPDLHDFIGDIRAAFCELRDVSAGRVAGARGGAVEAEGRRPPRPARARKQRLEQAHTQAS
ncbi:MAG: wax ester/triacylglycerol synthase family O-acyltransferase [Deltaproteobacteria bacterium]|nr:wax ester/triacylglycerol synthase family O-acyltransferase [Deltaproteobacteria bacterium]